MGEFTNSYKDTDVADYLNQIRQEAAQKKAGNTSSQKFTPNYIIPNPDGIQIADAAVEQSTTNVKSAADTLSLGDSFTQQVGYTTPWQVMESDTSVSTLKILAKFNNSVVDSSGNGNNGTAEGSPSYVQGIVDYAIKFVSGSSQDVLFGNVANIGISDFAISCWVELFVLGQTNCFLVKRSQASTTAVGWRVGAGTANRLFFTLCDGSASRIETVFASGALALGTKYHVVFNFTRAGNAEGFVNGVSVGTGSISAQQLTLTNADSMYAGRNRSDSANYSDVSVDDLRLYVGTTLTTTEITSLYNNGLVNVGSKTQRPARVGFAEA